MSNASERLKWTTGVPKGGDIEFYTATSRQEIDRVSEYSALLRILDWAFYSTPELLIFDLARFKAEIIAGKYRDRDANPSLIHDNAVAELVQAYYKWGMKNHSRWSVEDPTNVSGNVRTMLFPSSHVEILAAVGERVEQPPFQVARHLGNAMLSDLGVPDYSRYNTWNNSRGAANLALVELAGSAVYEVLEGTNVDPVLPVYKHWDGSGGISAFPTYGMDPITTMMYQGMAIETWREAGLAVDDPMPIFLHTES